MWVDLLLRIGPFIVCLAALSMFSYMRKSIKQQPAYQKKLIHSGTHFKMSACLVKTLTTYVAVDSVCRIFVLSELPDRDILISDMDCTVSFCSKQAEAGNNNIGSPTTVPTGKNE